MIDITDSFGNTSEGYRQHPTLHKRDSKGKHRTWSMQRDGNRYRTLSGLADGKQAVSDWTVVTEAKSQDTPELQALFEVKARYRHQLDREYHLDADDIDTAKMIEPMLAKKYGKFPGPGYGQPKLDGMRCIMTKDGMFTRQGRPIVAVPHIFEAAAEFFRNNPGRIFDGELYNHDLHDDFQQLMSICRKQNPTAEQLEQSKQQVQYHVYDMVEDRPFAERQSLLSTAVDMLNSDSIRLVRTEQMNTEGAFDLAYAEWVGDGYEGGMFRPNGDEGYQLGARSKFLLKRKDFETAEFPVVRWEEGKGNWAGAIKRVVCEDPDTGIEFGAGVRGSREHLTSLVGTQAPSEVTLRFFGRSNDGVPRFPVVIDMHFNGRKD